MHHRGSSRSPEFLVIGAMKSGTTTLYRDLLGNPSIFLPEKEANFLRNEISASAYARAYRAAAPQQRCGDVSADYAMLPESADVVPRAKRLLGNSVKVVYLVREPVSRTISHHAHLAVRHGAERIGSDINRCVRDHPFLIECSRYARQLQPWVDAFGKRAIHVIKFEDYITQRQETIEGLCAFLGVPADAPSINGDVVYNRTAGKPVVAGHWKTMLESTFYRRVVRPLFSTTVRDALRSRLLPKARVVPAPPRRETVRYIVERVRDDIAELQALLGHDQPMWDLDAVLQRHGMKQESSRQRNRSDRRAA